jgi:YD repeat-containing protein
MISKNRLTRTVNSVTESYSYDAGDKLTGIVRGSGTTAFSYDYESRVTSITKPGMTTNSFS